MSLSMMVLAGFLSALPVGPSLYELFCQALRGNGFPRRSLLAYIIADLCHLALAFYLCSFVNENELLRKTLYVITTVCMLFAAIRLMIKKSPTNIATSKLKGASEVFFLALLNPAILLFYVTLISSVTSNVTLSVAVFSLSFLFFLGVLLLALPRLFQQRTVSFAWIDRVAALAFAGIALKFVFLI